MRILFLSPRQSWPTVSGAKLRDYYFAKALGRRAQLTYMYFAERGGTTPGLTEFPFCERVVAVPAPAMYTPAKVLRGLLGRQPLPVVNYTSPEMREAIRGALSGGHFDMIHFDAVQMAAYVPLIQQWLPGARIVFNWHNIESELMRRYAGTAPTIVHRIYGNLTARRLETLERELLKGCFGHLVCSGREQEQLQRIAPEARLAVIENGVDAGAFSAIPGGGAARNNLVFVGSMSYHANIDAAVWFTRELWPGIRRRFPQWTLSLVGSNPSPAVQALAGDGVVVTGTVPSIEPYYGQALAAIVPLRSGAGTRLKILEAMAAGVPVISTTLGAEGLDVAPGENILIADTAADWIAALESIAGNESRWDSIGGRGRALVTSRYDWEILGNQLFETYRRWLEAA
jgi:glycosyltransferase involved in cell wall biosynthesis